MKEKMARYIKKNFPNAVLDQFLDTRWGVEYTFYPMPGAEEPYTCILNEYGGLLIMSDF